MMMDAVLVNNIVLLLIGLTSLYTAWLSKKTKEAAEKTEVNTNSMKDALILSTREASHAAGKEEGRIEGREIAATLAQGILSEKKGT